MPTTCTLGVMDADGTYHGHQRFPTAESELIPRVVAIDARTKRLALEEGNSRNFCIARWAALLLDPYVDEVFVCDPRGTRSSAGTPLGSDQADAYALCRLLCLGKLKAVYQAADDERAVFKVIVQRYHPDWRKFEPPLRRQNGRFLFESWQCYAY